MTDHPSPATPTTAGTADRAVAPPSRPRDRHPRPLLAFLATALALLAIAGCSRSDDGAAAGGTGAGAGAGAAAPSTAGPGLSGGSGPGATAGVAAGTGASAPSDTSGNVDTAAGTSPGAASMPPSVISPPPSAVAAANQAGNAETGGAMPGLAVYTANCAACHAAGVAGAPKLGDKVDWGTRLAQGKDTLYQHAINGYQGQKGVMPAKGGNASLTDAQVRQAVDYMVSR